MILDCLDKKQKCRYCDKEFYNRKEFDYEFLEYCSSDCFFEDIENATDYENDI